MRSFVGRLLGYFGRGLVLIAPIAITISVCVWLLSAVDDVIVSRLADDNPLKVPGVGLAITVSVITLLGFLGSNFIAKSALGLMDRVLDRLPVVRLLYSAIRDVLNAFVGDKRRFDQPVSVLLDPTGSVRMFGFVTQDSLAVLGLPTHVSVYCPHSYNFSGQLVVVAANQVERLHKPSADMMAFIVSGGVAGLNDGAVARAGKRTKRSAKSSMPGSAKGADEVTKPVGPPAG